MNFQRNQSEKFDDKKAELAEAFAIRIVNLEKYLREERKEKRISDQIFRSATSIGANIAEAKYAESPLDYIHKLSISQKEASETLFWLRILRKTEYITDPQFKSLYNDCSELLRVITRVIITKRENLEKEKNFHN